MGARLRAYLTPEEDRTLFELRTATTVPQRVKDRAEVLRLSHRGWYVEQIADFFSWHLQTVRETLHRWREKGLGGLWRRLVGVNNAVGAKPTSNIWNAY